MMLLDYEPETGDQVVWTQYGPMPLQAARNAGLPYLPFMGMVVRVLHNSYRVLWNDGPGHVATHALHRVYPPRCPEKPHARHDGNVLQAAEQTRDLQ